MTSKKDLIELINETDNEKAIRLAYVFLRSYTEALVKEQKEAEST